MRIAVDFLLLVIAVWAAVATVREFDLVSANVTHALTVMEQPR